MENLHDNAFFILEEKVELPKGKKIVSKSGLWVIHQDLQKMSLYTSTSDSPRVFSISDLQLKDSNDEIKTIDFIEQDQIYIYAIRNKVPTGFFMKIGQEENNENVDDYSENCFNGFSMPSTLSFALDTIYFHREILTSFTPISGSFCIVSKEGISLHDQTFQIYFALIQQINFCLFSENFLYVTDGFKYIIYQFDLKFYEFDNENINCSHSALNLNFEENENKTYKSVYDATPICQKVLTAYGCPYDFISLSSCLLIILKNPKAQSFQVQIQKLNPDKSNDHDLYDISSEVKASAGNNQDYIHYFKFLEFDDCLLSVNTSQLGSSSLLDFYENPYTPVGDQFKLLNDINIIGIFNQEFALCDDDCIYKINTDYSKIKTDSSDVIASIMRRTNGMNNAFDRLLKKLQTAEESDLEKIVKRVGPSAKDPIAQMKFSRLILFSGISDPHRIILLMIEYISILGDDMIDETWVPFLEIFAHSQTENLLVSAIKNNIIKLNSRTIHSLKLYFGEKMHVEENVYNAGNLIDFAYACINMKSYDDARLVITLAELSEKYSKEQIDQVKNEFTEKSKNIYQKLEL